MFTSSRQKQQLLEEAFSLISYDPEAAQLLEMARADGIKIKFSNVRVASEVVGSYRLEDKRILLRPFTKEGKPVTGAALASTLMHELRHHWQNKILGLTKENKTHTRRDPLISLILSRTMEADAYAFEHKFLNNVEKVMDAMTSTFQKVLLIEQQNPALTKEECLDLAVQRSERVRLDGPETLRDQFFSMMKQRNLFDSYDHEEAFRQHCIRTNRYANKKLFDKFKDIPFITISDIRGMLRAGIAKNAPSYLNDLSDREFEVLAIRGANIEARKTLKLVKKFNEAATRQDTIKAKEISNIVRDRIHDLKAHKVDWFG